MKSVKTPKGRKTKPGKATPTTKPGFKTRVIPLLGTPNLPDNLLRQFDKLCDGYNLDREKVLADFVKRSLNSCKTDSDYRDNIVDDNRLKPGSEAARLQEARLKWLKPPQEPELEEKPNPKLKGFDMLGEFEHVKEQL